MKSRKPRRPSDPRPGNKPYYINEFCPQCGDPLVLVDKAENPRTPEDNIWHDEWMCPVCKDGVYMDWPTRKC
jgi:ribosomal protein S27AE